MLTRLQQQNLGKVWRKEEHVVMNELLSRTLRRGDRVLVKRLLDRGGPGKFWEDDIYVVARRPDPENAVYEVELENGSGRKQMLHRNLLLPCPFLPDEANTHNLRETHHHCRL